MKPLNLNEAEYRTLVCCIDHTLAHINGDLSNTLQTWTAKHCMRYTREEVNLLKNKVETADKGIEK